MQKHEPLACGVRSVINNLMHKSSTMSFVPAIVSLMAVILLVGCAGDHGNKMPITTKSEKAKEYYITARDFAENLHDQDAISYYMMAIEEDSTFALAYLGLSFVRFRTNVTEGVNCLNHAINFVDNVSEGERLWIRGLEDGVNGDTRGQFENWDKLTKLHHSDERVHNIMGGYYYGQQEYAKAVSEFRKGKEINPDYAPQYNMMGYSYRFLGKYKAAEDAFKTYIKLVPDDPNPYDSYAELLMKIGEFKESIDYYEKALEIDPLFGASRMGIATNLVFLNKHEDARRLLQDWIRTTDEPGDKRLALGGIAVAYADEGRLAEALQAVMRQIPLDEQVGDYLGMLNDLTVAGNILLEMDRPDQARQYYDRALAAVIDADGVSDALKLNTQAGHVYAMARVAIAKRDFSTARELATEYLGQTEAAENPAQMRLYHELLGIMALEEGDFREAVDELKQANQQNTYNLYRMMLAYEGLDDPKNARKMCEAVSFYNQLMNLNYAFVRQKARTRLTKI